MAELLRIERVRQEERQYFLDRILEASPSGVLTLDFENRISLANPSAARMLGARPEDLLGRKLAELRAPFARELDALPTAGAARVLSLAGSRRIKAQAGEFLDRGSPRPFLVLEELTEELRPLRESGVREAHPDDVARGEQLARRGALAARVVSPLLGSSCGPRTGRTSATRSPPSSRGPSS